MWATEPRKHFFALLAKAHSEIRDNHSEQIKFEKFLASTVGLLPIIPADSYLKAMGWELTVDSNGEQELVRSGPLTDQNFALTTNVSALDIIEHCYKIGLVARPAHSLRSGRGQILSMGSAMAMSFAAAPNSTPSFGNRKAVIASEAQQQVC